MIISSSTLEVFGGGGNLPKCHAAGTPYNRSRRQNGGGNTVPIEAAGTVSRRLHNASTKWVDF